MIDIIYRPENVGREFLTSKGKSITMRKYHLTDKEMEVNKERWLSDVKGISKGTKGMAGELFFNPYRQGIYYYQIQTLFLLGANHWHNLTDIVNKLEAYTSCIVLDDSIVKEKGYKTAWDKFRGKNSRSFAISSKDYIGRIQENFIMLQRLSQRHPCGYKLYQVCSAIDIKRSDMIGFPQGIFSYRLSTYPKQVQALPMKDFSEFTFPKNEGNYINRKFIGTVVTIDKVIKSGVVI